MLKEYLIKNAIQGCLVVCDSRILLKHLNSIMWQITAVVAKKKMYIIMYMLSSQQHTKS